MLTVSPCNSHSYNVSEQTEQRIIYILQWIKLTLLPSSRSYTGVIKSRAHKSTYLGSRIKISKYNSEMNVGCQSIKGVKIPILKEKSWQLDDEKSGKLFQFLFSH